MGEQVGWVYPLFPNTYLYNKKSVKQNYIRQRSPFVSSRSQVSNSNCSRLNNNRGNQSRYDTTIQKLEHQNMYRIPRYSSKLSNTFRKTNGYTTVV